MKVKDLAKLLSQAEPDDEAYVTDSPEIHKKAGGIAVAAFEALEPITKTTGKILRFTLMMGKQAEGIGSPITFRLEKPEYFGSPWQ
ncbi:MAG: hypothetical protein PHY02_06510 [Phycisphaerae bacterium]|nr:hypothetical protein [Phycisphaerae bacterium]